MKNKRKYMLAVASASTALLLQACGGGGGGGGGGSADAVSADATPDSMPGVTTGTVSAPFEPSDIARYLLVGPDRLSSGRRLQTYEQIDGAVVSMNDNVLSGNDRMVGSVAGDASFALGIWRTGAVSYDKGADILTGNDGREYHYILYNGLQSLPMSGNFECDTGTFTTPIRISGTGPLRGRATGNARLSFDANGANVDASVTVSASEEGRRTFSTTGMSASDITFNAGQGNVALGNAGNGAYAVVGLYQVAAGGSVYRGTYRFLCK